MSPTAPQSRKPLRLKGLNLRQVSLRLGLLSALALPLFATTVGQGHAQGCADVDLVLAIDGSGSIDATEFSLQQQGYAAAFRRKDVQQALQAVGVVDVAVVLWGDTEMAVQTVPWRRLNGPGSADALASDLERLFRKVTGDTGVGRALWQSLDLLDMTGQCGLRKIVNFSGDGYESLSLAPRNHVPLPKARKRAETMRVEVNALAVENEVPDLAEWYQDRLLVGAGAFVMRVNGFDSFADAIAEKLIREIKLPDLAVSQAGGAESKI